MIFLQIAGGILGLILIFLLGYVLYSLVRAVVNHEKKKGGGRYGK